MTSKNNHGGNVRDLARRAGCAQEDLLDFSASINPLGPPECLRQVISRNIERLAHYPDPYAEELAEALAQKERARPASCHIGADEIIAGNGSTEILFALARAIKPLRAVIPVPSYADYAQAATLAGAEIQTLKLDAAAGFALDWSALGRMLAGGELVFLGAPNNPTGQLFDLGEFRHFSAEHPATVFAVDEAFADFVADGGASSVVRQPNVVAVRSLTKFYAFPGLRLGYAIAPLELAGRIREQIPAWSVNTLAQAAGVAVLKDEAYGRRTRDLITRQRAALTQSLQRFPGLHVYPSQANFLLVRLDRADWNALTLGQALLKQGIAIRGCDTFAGLDERFFRIAVREEEENARLIEALGLILEMPARRTTRPKRQPALMIQGTTSSAGKSILTTALCRILLQDGLRVAPFKSQNMSLNSFVTREGGEMGRAQVVQAQACRLEPDVRMNPILLKPGSETGCQVIVRGKPVGQMQVAEYVRYKPQAFEIATQCYDSLAAKFDVMILEGAGSPAEVNLKSHDIVNMAMARHAKAPVLIVGDIDRGGVFASFIGVMETLAPWERALVSGWLVNRFRGDASLLAPALEYTLDHTGRPVLGVVPYLNELNLPQEDSVNFKSGELDAAPGDETLIDIAVIDLPHISNFTDFDAFAIEKDVRVRIVRSAEQLGVPDAIILPGSKNTAGDLHYLKSNGFAGRIIRLATEDKSEIVGICAGFQMLGREICDPHGIETSEPMTGGICLLDVRTTMAGAKTLQRASARHAASNLEVRGYEIHHGESVIGSSQTAFVRADGQAVGAARPDHRVWGVYLHGVFDADPFRRWFIDRLRVRRGLAPLGAIGASYDIEPALDRLAAAVRESVRMDEIYRLLGI
jgi:cobyric acid synthase CobQ/L-threonine-O-3-phosphate decarboxylase